MVVAVCVAMTSPTASGALWLIPNTLDLGTADAPPIEQVLPLGVLQRAARLTHWLAEDAKTARAFLKRVDRVVPLARPLQALSIVELPRPPKGGARTLAAASDVAQLLAPALAGDDVGLISEAGLPAVADPGASLVAAAHAAGIRVYPLAGPTSLMLALAASGLHGQCFAFVGYLPTDAAQRAARITALEGLSRREHQTQIVIETPYRNAALATALLAALQPTTRLAIACGVTMPGGWCLMRRVSDWRGAPPAFSDRTLPAVFLWLAN
jgi:16S rRNA (cytidine1402-2'-O)-methyltransferase